MNQILFQETAKLSKPVPPEKVIDLHEKFIAPSSETSKYPPKLHKTWGTIFFMIVIHLLSIVALQPKFWSIPSIMSLFFFYWVTACLGVTLGYHRLLSHRAFIVPLWLERFFATCGALSCQHGPIDWVGLHRHHHSFSDTEVDHHNSKRGFWWSHMGWMFEDVEALKAVPKLSRDLIKDPYYRFLNKYFLFLQIPIGLTLFAMGEKLGVGGWSMVLWGIPLRLVVVYHITWLVNSATHCWGSIAFDSGDESRNNAWVAALTFGEGWHNNHHAFPNSAKQGLFKGQIDLTWEHIKLLARFGFAKKIKLPSRTYY